MKVLLNHFNNKFFLFLIPLIFLLTAGSCDRTSIRGAGKIVSETEEFHVGKEYNLKLEIPTELEGKVYRAIWTCEPENGAEFSYEQNTIIGAETVNFKKDRAATIVPGEPGEITVKVLMIYYRQTSPQYIAQKKILVTED